MIAFILSNENGILEMWV